MSCGHIDKLSITSFFCLQEALDDLEEEKALLGGEETYDATSSSDEDDRREGASEESTAKVTPSKSVEGLDGEGFSGHDLYRCGNSPCLFSAADQASFRDHCATPGRCEFSPRSSHDLVCYHCGRQLKHAATLLEHLNKAHGPRRYRCSLCLSRGTGAAVVRAHMKGAHKVVNAKVVPVKAGSSSEQEHFLLVPRSSAAVSSASSATSTSNKASTSAKTAQSVSKDTFSPLEVDSLPRPSVSWFPMRCSECDFSTRVRKNLEKHLKLHLRRDKERKKKLESLSDDDKPLHVPVITPINAPSILDPRSDRATKMSNLLDCDADEYSRPMSDEDYAAMPAFVPESMRQVNLTYVQLNFSYLIFEFPSGRLAT